MVKVAKRRFIDERHLDELIDWIGKSEEDSVMSEELFEYHEMLVSIHSIDLKFGPRKSANYARETFKVSQYRANQLVCETKELFYADTKYTKNALKNWILMELECQYNLVKATWSNSKDSDVATKILNAMKDIGEVNLPDETTIPPSFYEKPVRIFTINPEHIGLEKQNAKELALVIDSMKDAPEKYKDKAKQDAGIVEIDFEEYLDGIEKEIENK